MPLQLLIRNAILNSARRQTKGAVLSLPKAWPSCRTEEAVVRFWATAAFSGFLDEALPALRAGNGNFPLPLGDADQLPALRAVIIPMVPVLQPVKELQELPVFLVALIGIPGQAAEQHPSHGNIGQQRQHRDSEDRADQTQRHPEDQDDRVELICAAVPSRHELPKPQPQLLKHSITW